MLSKIMIPVDGSALAERALPYAEQIAGITGAALYLVRVVEPPVIRGFVSGAVYEDLLTTTVDEASRYVEHTRVAVAARLRSRVEGEQLFGKPIEALLAYESDKDIDLVVMCSHGRSALARFALGSVAYGLVRYGMAPVLLVRGFGPVCPLQQVVLPLDGSVSAEAALQVVQQLAGTPVEKVTLVETITDPYQRPATEEYLAEKAQLVRKWGLGCQSYVMHGDPADTIIGVAGTDKLVVMATHGRTGLARWALGSVADRVTRHGTGPVLLVRAGASAMEPPAGRTWQA